MALIPCPECQQKVSDQAASCPGCGHPMRTSPIRGPIVSGGARQPVQTIEQTGKQFKSIMAAGVAAMVLGLIISLSGSSLLGAAIMFVGLMAYIVARTSAWWYHG